MNILFMCVANSARSQLAEGLAKNIFNNQAHIQSAGSKPSTVNPFAIRVLNEIGIDISTHFSKSVNELPADFINQLDYVITLCAEEVCPVIISHAKKLHWPLPDPAGTGTEAELILRFQETRNELLDRLNEFYSEWLKSTDKNDGLPDQF